jgi:hypothetical protein
MSGRLHPADVEAIAVRVSELLVDQLTKTRRPRALLTAAEVAAFLGVDAEYVRDHADELQAVRLGNGPKARMRFRPEAVEEFIASISGGTATPEPTPVRQRRRRAPTAGNVAELLPIRGAAPGR